MSIKMEDSKTITKEVEDSGRSKLLCKFCMKAMKLKKVKIGPFIRSRRQTGKCLIEEMPQILVFLHLYFRVYSKLSSYDEETIVSIVTVDKQKLNDVFFHIPIQTLNQSLENSLKESGARKS